MPSGKKNKKRVRRPAASTTAPSSGGVQKPNTKRGRLLSGTEAATGKVIRFRPDSIKVVELKNDTGDVIGISYPSKPDDEAKVTKWASKANRTSDTKYIKDYSKNATRDKTRFSAAPWGTAKRPFYVHAHANPRTFSVTTKTGKKIRVDGDTHGRLLSGNSHFQQATRTRSPKPVVYMSCKSGNPSGDAAATSTAFLHNEGNQSTFYAPTGNGVRNTRGSKSFYGVRPQPDGGTGEFATFPPKH